MSVQDRFAELWTDYLEGDLDDGGVEELRELMAADESLSKRAADQLQTHRLLGLIVAEALPQRDEFIRETLAQLPESQDAFVSHVMSQVERANVPPQKSREAVGVNSRRMWIAAALIFVGVMLFSFWPKGPTPIATDDTQQKERAAVKGNVRLASSAHAKFFGELSPPVGAALASRREYVLMSGLVEVSFPAGASAILEGPAVFRVLSDESLALDVGRCSVHAPNGAEGFHIETPATRVVDRGTRFSVSVGETSDTEVQVIEGAADIYGRRDDAGPAAEVRLTNGEARRFATAGGSEVETVPFDATNYRRQLPDRVISYETTKDENGSAENLTSVTVQRGGRITDVAVDDLIAARVTWFKTTEPRAFLCGTATLPKSNAAWLTDHSLVTGVINPDGSREPLTNDPVLEGKLGTPGMAIQFDRPVVNDPGADIVFFDLQTFGNPPDGDAFHVSPLKFREGLKSHTVKTYDLTMESPEAQVLTNFHVHFFATAVESLSKLNAIDYSSQKQSNKFRGLAVGIDLSDMGYAAGETVEGLFIQDALDDGHRVDPVFIAGLPEMK